MRGSVMATRWAHNPSLRVRLSAALPTIPGSGFLPRRESRRKVREPYVWAGPDLGRSGSAVAANACLALPN